MWQSALVSMCFGFGGSPEDTPLFNYISQDRAISAYYHIASPRFTCSQGTSAPNFGVFNQAVNCTQASASQNSSLGDSTITIVAASQSNFVTLPNFTTSQSRATIIFDVIEPNLRFRLEGNVLEQQNGGTEVTLELTEGGSYHFDTNGPFRICDLLPEERYTLVARTSGSTGHTGSLSVTFKAARIGDVNGDNLVNINDLLIVISAWGPCQNPQNCAADLNCDNAVNVNDLVQVIGHWGA